MSNYFKTTHILSISFYLLFRNTATSFTFVPVAPVMISPPDLSSMRLCDRTEKSSCFPCLAVQLVCQHNGLISQFFTCIFCSLTKVSDSSGNVRQFS